MTNQTVTATLVPTVERSTFVNGLFKVRFLWIESFIFDTAGSLSQQYEGGYWGYHRLSNGGFYMAPASPSSFRVQCANGYEGTLTADAFGVTCSLYAYSMLSFSPDTDFGELCARHYHLLRDHSLQHAEATKIFQAID